MLLLAVLAPFVLSRDIGLPSFSDTGPIGDTIGGLASPFLNLLGSLLIYLSFQEQLEANDIARRQFQNISDTEIQRKRRIKQLIVWDLENRIKKEALNIKAGLEEYVPNVGKGNMPFVDYVDFNDEIFKANSLNDYFEIFNKDVEDLSVLCNFYNRVSFIYKNTPIFSSKKLTQDKINVNSWPWDDMKKKQDYFNQLPEKYKRTSESLIKNIDSLVPEIDKFIAKYK